MTMAGSSRRCAPASEISLVADQETTLGGRATGLARNRGGELLRHALTEHWRRLRYRSRGAELDERLGASIRLDDTCSFRYSPLIKIVVLPVCSAIFKSRTDDHTNVFQFRWVRAWRLRDRVLLRPHDWENMTPKAVT